MRQHITKGYTISVLELVSAFADTWLSLDAYDKDNLVANGETKKQVILTVEKLSKFLVEFKKELPRKGEATDIFGAFKNHPTSFNRLNVIYC